MERDLQRARQGADVGDTGSIEFTKDAGKYFGESCPDHSVELH